MSMGGPEKGTEGKIYIYISEEQFWRKYSLHDYNLYKRKQKKTKKIRSLVGRKRRQDAYFVNMGQL